MKHLGWIVLALVIWGMMQKKPAASPAPGAINQANSDASQAMAGANPNVVDDVALSQAVNSVSIFTGTLTDSQGNPIPGGT